MTACRHYGNLWFRREQIVMLDYGQPVASKDAERAVIRDVLIYTAFLFVVLGAIGLVMTGSLSLLGFVLFIFGTGGLGLTWLVHVEYTAARQYGRPPRINRLFG
jgi:hypothetical protein